MMGKIGKNHKRKSNRVKKGKKKNQENVEAFSHPSAKLLDFPASFAILSFWFLICNVEFDLNSTCLDRLDNLGIISLQKL